MSHAEKLYHLLPLKNFNQHNFGNFPILMGVIEIIFRTRVLLLKKKKKSFQSKMENVKKKRPKLTTYERRQQKNSTILYNGENGLDIIPNCWKAVKCVTSQFGWFCPNDQGVPSFTPRIRYVMNDS